MPIEVKCECCVAVGISIGFGIGIGVLRPRLLPLVMALTTLALPAEAGLSVSQNW